MSYTHAIFIDESGTGCPKEEINTFWITVAMAVPITELEKLDNGIKKIVASYLRQGETEIRGADLPRQLVPGATIDDIMENVSILFKEVGATTWGVGSKASNTNFPVGFEPPKKTKMSIKHIVRHLLMERINGYLDNGYGGSGSYLVVWDISDVGELIEFSKNNSCFINGYNGKSRSQRLAPAILGGISDDWGGLQIADLFAHCALHHCACEHSYGCISFNQEKKNAFDKWIYPKFQVDFLGNKVGWKYW